MIVDPICFKRPPIANTLVLLAHIAFCLPHSVRQLNDDFGNVYFISGLALYVYHTLIPKKELKSQVWHFSGIKVNHLFIVKTAVYRNFNFVVICPLYYEKKNSLKSKIFLSQIAELFSIDPMANQFI